MIVLPEYFKPHLCASQDETRYALCRVEIEGDMAVACDGRTLVAGTIYHDEEPPSDDWGSLSVEACKDITAMRCGGEFAGKLTLKSGEVKTRVDFDKEVTYAQPSEASYPNWEGALPTFEPESNPISICVNALFLARVAEAIGARKAKPEVCLTFCPNAHGEMGPILITRKETDRFGILMPCKMPGHQPLENAAYRQALEGAEDRKERRKLGRKSNPKPEPVNHAAAYMVAVMEWAKRNGIEGTPDAIRRAFEDARTLTLIGGDA